MKIYLKKKLIEPSETPCQGCYCEICDYAIHDGFDNCPNCGKNLTSFILRYTEQKVSDMLRTLANMIAQDAKKRKGGYSHYVEDLIKFAKNNPTEGAGE